MQIYLEKTKKFGKSVVISTSEHKLKIFTNEIDPADFSDAKDINVLTNAKSGTSDITKEGGMSVVSPGEFEKAGIYVLAQKNSPKDPGMMNFIEIEVENVRVLYYSAASEINRDLVNQIGVIDVLILGVFKDFENQVKAVSVIDPQILVPVFGPNVDIEKFKSEVGAKFDEEKKFKCSASDFSNEEYVLHGVILQD